MGWVHSNPLVSVELKYLENKSQEVSSARNIDFLPAIQQNLVLNIQAMVQALSQQRTEEPSSFSFIPMTSAQSLAWIFGFDSPLPSFIHYANFLRSFPHLSLHLPSPSTSSFLSFTFSLLNSKSGPASEKGKRKHPAASYDYPPKNYCSHLAERDLLGAKYHLSYVTSCRHLQHEVT